ncbi:MAG: START domain-containing protein [Pseudomonadota bacterium]|nr:START domain-containing protein [Pseudomonadota bacterium]
MMVLYSAGPAAEELWKRVKSQDGIEVFSRPVAGSPFNSLRGVMRVNASLNAVVSLLRDYEARPAWDSLCAESRVLQSISATGELVYLHDDLPWPVTDRDMVMEVKWSQDPVSRVVTMQATAVNGGVPENADRIRLTQAVNSWVLTPLEGGIVEVSAEAHLDPAGPLPSWLINYLAKDAPYNSLQKIRELIKNEKYARSKLAFVSER